MPENVYTWREQKFFPKKPYNSIYVALFVQALRVVLIAKIKGRISFQIEKFSSMTLS